jgi:hypothetical protein
MIVARHPAAAGLPGNRAKREPIRARYDPYPSRLIVLIVARLSDPITPSLRDGFSIESVPGNKLPGYDHLVPPG